ncbi:MAG: hydroxymethylbilane synthase [Armatimonadota bacterium]|nr:hydroxymethylbilane synthase [Armatimonadota bacterium]MDR5690201.1 hydroxymethylbilane synthase [Armatimonadota bacterium]MDR7387307.1 hydroxymethylbilane synthase [Armatimonadota bacterium]MDR7389603.1 hydroxymethylbilane synthase [Armatimonadota bacterium]MDR7390551.1 hydroxymethylbilane synthase [Armatimonadota bacterium]
MTLRVGTRASSLSRRQTDWVLQLLRRADPRLQFHVVPVRTAGDRSSRPIAELGGVGWFTRELERALLEGTVDLVVHSLKDLPTETPGGLVVAATPPREDARDALVGRWPTLDALPRGARVGTSSPRRRAQLLAYRRDLEVVPLRGNVDTRLRKVDAGEVEAAVLAAAGLVRGGWEDRIRQYLDPEVMLPAPAQGALAVQVRESDAPLVELTRQIDHPPTRAAVRAERAFLRALGGGCTLPVGALATVEGDRLCLQVRVLSEDGSRQVSARREGRPDDPERLGHEVAEEVRPFLSLMGGGP